MKRILFVCTGNTCRSAMAEGLMRKIVAELPRAADLEIFSAGTTVIPEMPASADAVTVMAAEGIDITGHRAQALSAELTQSADLILTMTAKHKAQIIRLFPETAQRVFTIKEFVGSVGDVCDPYGGDITVYRTCAAELKELLKKAAEKLDKQG